MKLIFDLFPLLVFFAAFEFYDIYIATAAAIIATLIQVGLFWFRQGRFETMHLVTLVAISVFGGLTIYLQDDVFIKSKPTIVNWIFSIIIFAMMFTKKTALEFIMGQQLSLPKSIWRAVNLAWAIFFAVLGLLNIYVAFYYNLEADIQTRTESWVNFKVFGMLALTIFFSILQMVFVSKHIVEDETSTLTDN